MAISLVVSEILTFHSNRGHTSYRFRYRVQSKVTKFSHPLVFCAPAEGDPVGIGYRRRRSKN